MLKRYDIISLADPRDAAARSSDYGPTGEAEVIPLHNRTENADSRVPRLS